MSVIPMALMEPRRVYRIHSRNLVIGVWNPETRGFIGIREKLGSQYLFTEYHWEADPHVGTVRPIEVLDLLPDGIRLAQDLGQECGQCDKPVHFQDGQWQHDDGDSWCESYVLSIPNTALFDYLAPLVEAEIARNTAEFLRLEQERLYQAYKPKTKEEAEQEDVRQANTRARVDAFMAERKARFEAKQGEQDGS